MAAQRAKSTFLARKGRLDGYSTKRSFRLQTDHPLVQPFFVQERGMGSCCTISPFSSTQIWSAVATGTKPMSDHKGVSIGSQSREALLDQTFVFAVQIAGRLVRIRIRGSAKIARAMASRWR